MKPSGPLKILSEVRDLQIVDCYGVRCGIADEIEFDGGAGKALRVHAILVGPGAYASRMPHWLAAIVWFAFGQRIVRVPWSAIETVTGEIRLNVRATELGLGVVERKVARAMPRAGAL